MYRRNVPFVLILRGNADDAGVHHDGFASRLFVITR